MKIKNLSVALLAISGLCAATAFASTITYETQSTGLSVPADYQAVWNSQNSTITSNSLADFNGVGPVNGTIAHLEVDFTVGSPAHIIFQLAPDAGYGGALYLDGTLIAQNKSDLWWEGSWGNVGELLTSSSLALTSGSHELEGFWIEGCCSGAQGGRYSLDGGSTWMSLSVANLDTLAVPEPGIMTLLGIGFIGLGFSRRKRAI